MRWTRQPQISARINQANPLTRGLAFVQLGASSTTLGKWPSGILDDNVFRKACPSGVGFGTASSADPIRTIDAAPTSGSVFSIFVVASTDPSAASIQTIIDNDRGDIGGNARCFQFRLSSNTLDLIRFNSTGSPFFATSTAIANETWLTGVRAGAVCDGATFSAFANGTKIAGTTITGTPSTGDGTAWRMGNYRGGGGTPWRGSLPLVAIWDRALSDAEMAAISANPWQIFAPLIAPRTYEDSAGGVQSFSYTGTGGVVASGTAAIVKAILPVGSGGIMLSGTAGKLIGKIIAGAGGITFSGQATGLRGAARDTAGGVLFAGAASVSFGYANVFKCTILTPDGTIRMILDSEVGTGKKPLVLDGDRWRQRQVAEGTPIIYVGVRYRLLHPGETLEV